MLLPTSLGALWLEARAGVAARLAPVLRLDGAPQRKPKPRRGGSAVARMVPTDAAGVQILGERAKLGSRECPSALVVTKRLLAVVLILGSVSILSFTFSARAYASESRPVPVQGSKLTSPTHHKSQSTRGSLETCTNAPGTDAVQCISIDRDNTNAAPPGKLSNIKSVQSEYRYLPTGLVKSAPNICDRHHELAYYDSGNRRIRAIDPPGCVNGMAASATLGDSVDFDIGNNIDKATPICTRSKNSATAQNWTPYACQQSS